MHFKKLGLLMFGGLACLCHATESHRKTFNLASHSHYYWKLSQDSAQPYTPGSPDTFNDYFDISVNTTGTEAMCPGTTYYTLSTQSNQLYTLNPGTPIDYTAIWDLNNTALYAVSQSMNVRYTPLSNDSLFLYQDKQSNFYLCQIAKSRWHSPCANVSEEPPEYTGFDSLTVACEKAIDSGPRFQEPAPLAIWAPVVQRPISWRNGELRLPADEQVLSLIDPSGVVVPYRLEEYADGSHSVIPLTSGTRMLWIIVSQQGRARLYRMTPGL